MKKRALISVSDKDGVVEFATELVGLGYEILSTGGTAKMLDDYGIECTQVSDITKFPEFLDGRVKTLHPSIHGGILSMRSNPDHMAQIKKLGIGTIDIVAVNLYPFKATILKPDCSFEDAVENIDIGGPSMIRAAAKNYQDVCVLVDSSDYPKVIAELRKGEVSLKTKKNLMFKAFSHTAAYDALISNYLACEQKIQFPDELTLTFTKKQDLRYGENPHQKAAFYSDILPKKSALDTAEIMQGKELSFNNINDAAGALDLLNEYNKPTCVAVKHTNPCGVATAKDAYNAYITAHACDPVSIFGGIVAFNSPVCGKTAIELNKIFLEIIIAPEFTLDALATFSEKPNLRVLRIPSLAKPVDFKGAVDLKRVHGGLLIQDKDNSLYNKKDFNIVTKLKPTKTQLEQLDFAFKIVKHTKSNAIVVANDFKLLGVGGGQTNRIWAAKQALERAKKASEGAVLASDAFFPFSDCVELAAKHGIKAIIQPGGSVRDSESIDACNKLGIAMVFVGERHFKH